MKGYVLVRHSVVYFPGWKVVFDDHLKLAHEYTLTALHVMRDLSNPNETTILMKAEEIEKAQEFMSSDLLKRAMQKAGVHTKPEISYLVGGPDSIEG